MKCPKCKDVELTRVVRSGVEIEVCPECHGIWLDRGELDKLTSQADQAGVSSPPSDRWHDRHEELGDRLTSETSPDRTERRLFKDTSDTKAPLALWALSARTASSILSDLC